MKKNYIILLIGVLALIGLDQISKQIFESMLLISSTEVNNHIYVNSEVISIIDGFFRLTLRYNTGGAWSIFSGNMIFFYIITVFALGLFYFMAKDVDFKGRKLYSIAVMLIIAGAIGNFIDRLLFQKVIDFLDFIIFGYDFPVFNIADICLVVGVIIFAVDVLFEEQLYGKNNSKPE